MKQLIINAQTGEETIIDLPDNPVLPELPPVPTPEEQIAALKARLAVAEQSAADNALTQQELIEILIDTGVI